MNVFFDTNVLLDVLMNREPFYEHSAMAWTLAETRRIDGMVSAVSFPTVFYIARRTKGRRNARKAMTILRKAFNIAVCDEGIITQAIDSGMKDFEDAVQFFSAVRAGADCLLTRNPHHFPADAVPVRTPVDFLAAHFTVGPEERPPE
ncbi:MAG: PIN domain-containing protein [Phycisphaerae bacterium]